MTTQAAPAAPKSTLATLIDSFAKLTAIFAAIAYFFGWVFTNAYYRHFQIEPSLLGIGWHDVLAQTGTVASSYAGRIDWRSLFAAAIVALAVFVAIKVVLDVIGVSLTRAFSEFNWVIALFLLCLPVLYGTSWLAKRAALEEAKRQRVSNADKSFVLFREEKGCDARGALKIFNDKRGLILLKATKDWFVLYATWGEPVEEHGERKFPAIRVFHVAASCIASIDSVINHPAID